MAKEPPTWLNNEFLEKALNAGKPDSSIKVISAEVKPAVAAGENYGSEMYRATVQVKNGTREEEVSIIIKASLSDGQFSGALMDEAFKREIHIFTKVLSAMQNIWGKKDLARFPPNCAQYIYSHTGTSETVIVMEDLKTSGFTLARTTVGLDLQHCLHVMKSLARFHATSVVIEKQNPKLISSMDENVLSKDEETKADPVFVNAVKGVAMEVEKWEGYEKYASRLYRLSETVVYHRKKCIRPDEKSFNVLIHGDLWKNNMMFKYSEETGEAEEVRLVDFQLSQWASPAVDLLYFLNSSASPEVLIENFDTLIKVYHKTLQDTLSILRYEDLAPTRDTLNKEITDRQVFAVISLAVARVGVLSDKDSILDIDEIVKGENTMKFSEGYKISLKKLLPFFDKMGWLNF